MLKKMSLHRARLTSLNFLEKRVGTVYWVDINGTLFVGFEADPNNTSEATKGSFIPRLFRSGMRN